MTLKYNGNGYRLARMVRKYWKNNSIELTKKDPNTLLLLHAEDFTDSSLNPKAITNNGATIGSSGKFNKCFLTGGSKTTTVECPPVNLGSSDFTIEFWIKATFITAWQGILGHRGGTNSDYGWAIQNNDIKKMSFEWSVTGTSKTSEVVSSVISSDNTWEHWAIVRYGNTVTMYRNGANAGSASISGAIYSTVQGLSIGYTRDSTTTGNPISAYIDELRISNIARWTSDFTPSVTSYDNLVSGGPYNWKTPGTASDYDNYEDVVQRYALRHAA